MKKCAIQINGLKAGELIDAIVQARLAGHNKIELRDGAKAVPGGVDSLPEWVREEIAIRFLRTKNGLTEKVTFIRDGVPITVYSRPDMTLALE